MLTKQTIEQFAYDLKKLLDVNLIDVIIHGSVVLNDFRPTQGDIDYIIITKNDLDEETNNKIFKLHDQYRSEKKLLLYQLEGTFYPIHALVDLKTPFIGCYIGTTRPYWRTITTFQNSYMDLCIIDKYGMHIMNANITIYKPTDDDIHKEHIKDYGNLLSSIKNADTVTLCNLASTVHWCARTIYYIRKGTITSKGEGCRWCQEMINRVVFRDLFRLVENKRFPYGEETVDKSSVATCIELLLYVGSLLQ